MLDVILLDLDGKLLENDKKVSHENLKRLLLVLIILLNVFLFVGCASKENSKISSLPVKQQKAVENSIKFIKSSSFTYRDSIDTNIFEIGNPNENTWKNVWSKDALVGENAVDTTDWVITIGSTSGHNFAVIVCDCSTSEVIGYMPIK